MSLKDVFTPDPVEDPKNEEEVEPVEPVEPVEEPTEPEAPAEEAPETDPEGVDEPEAPKDDEPAEPKPVEGETSRERALRQEVERLKREKREADLKPREIPNLDVKTEDDDTEETVTRAEALVLNSMQDEAFDAFLAEHPIYRRDDKKWEAFLAEFNDRRSIMSLAKKQGKTVNKGMFKSRLESVHRSIFGGNDPDAEAKKRAAVSSRAAIALRQSQGGSPGTSTPKPISLLPKPSGISTWVTKK